MVVSSIIETLTGYQLSQECSRRSVCSPNGVCGYTSSLTPVQSSHNTNIVVSTPQFPLL